MPASLQAAETATALNKGDTVPQFNCKLEKFVVNVRVGGTCGTHAVSNTSRCTFWGITNTENIMKGSELLLQIAEPKRKDGTDEAASKRQKMT